jgi:ubiquinone/menaquinone biosynthesis C-methylase UbiE
LAPKADAWNRLRYTAWAPFYDFVGRRFDGLRRRSIEGLRLRTGERVLIVGCGTGGDLPWLPAGVRVVATDLTPAMLARGRPKACGSVRFALMSGHALGLRPASFDAVILHLILAVMSEPAACLREARRILRPGGRIAVLDKFVADGQRPSLLRRGINVLSNALATDITRRLGDMLRASDTDLVVEADEPAAFAGFFRLIRLRRPG